LHISQFTKHFQIYHLIWSLSHIRQQVQIGYVAVNDLFIWKPVDQLIYGYKEMQLFLTIKIPHLNVDSLLINCDQNNITNRIYLPTEYKSIYFIFQKRKQPLSLVFFSLLSSRAFVNLRVSKFVYSVLLLFQFFCINDILSFKVRYKTLKYWTWVSENMKIQLIFIKEIFY
jgi:hypothetical protein